MGEVKLIGDGDDELAALAEGLREDIMDSLANFAAITIVDAVTGQDADARGGLSLEGSIRGIGKRLRLTFTLTDKSSGARVWSERYDRTLDDIFELEDEISAAVSSIIRIRMKSLEFERLRDVANDQLSVPELLTKAAGLFVRSMGDNDEVEEILRTALSLAPKNSMAHAMLAFCFYRRWEHSPMAVPPAQLAEVQALEEKSLDLDPNSYFARLLSAVRLQDIEGDFEGARDQVEAALAANPDFSQGQGMAAIVSCHTGEAATGIERLQAIMNAVKEDPQRFRHQRELAVAQYMNGDVANAVVTIKRLVNQSPALCRNGPVSIALQWLAGEEEGARDCVEELRLKYPDLTLANMRPFQFSDKQRSVELTQALAAAGLPLK